MQETMFNFYGKMIQKPASQKMKNEKKGIEQKGICAFMNIEI